MIKSPIKPLRSSMANALEHAANMPCKRGKIFSRAQIVKAVKSENRFKENLENIRIRMFGHRSGTNKRVANVRQAKKADGGGYRVVGLGHVPAPNFQTLKEILKQNNFTGIRQFGKVFAL